MVLAIGVLIYYELICYFKLIAQKKQIHYNGLGIFLLLIGIILLQILRIYCQQLFPDIPEYSYLFQNVSPLTEVLEKKSIKDILFVGSSLEVEGGYNLFMSLFKCFSKDFQLYLFFISCIEYVTFCYFCNKCNLNLYTALIVYISLTYISFQIGMLRQALACCIFFIALLNIKNKWHYFILVSIGFLFHRSMAFCFLLFWVNKYINPKYFQVLFIFSLIIYILKIEFINDLWATIMVEDSNRVSYYLNVERENNYLGIGFWERVLLFVTMTYFYTKFNSYELLRHPSIILLYNLGCCSIFLQLIFFSSPTITSRLRYYVVIFPMIFILENISHLIKSKKYITLCILPIYVYLIFYMYSQGGYLIGL